MIPDELRAIGKLVEALRPWLNKVVFAGGWAHRLYRLRPEAQYPGYRPLATLDADVAFQSGGVLKGDLGKALATAGFQEALIGEDAPPISQYRLGEEDNGFYAEFLVPLIGSGRRRDGSVDVTVREAGVTAQKLRYLEMLLVHPWEIQLHPTTSGALRAPATIRVPHPAAFIAQKLLIQQYRAPAKKPQDALYIHDTLELFGSSLEQLGQTWRDRVGPRLPRKTVDRVGSLTHELFGTVTDVIRSAVRIPDDRTILPATMQVVLSRRPSTDFQSDVAVRMNLCLRLRPPST